MNSKVIPELEARVVVVLSEEHGQAHPLLQGASDLPLHEWAQVNDCGAPGPSRDEPELFYQGEDDWEVQ